MSTFNDQNAESSSALPIGTSNPRSTQDDDEVLRWPAGDVMDSPRPASTANAADSLSSIQEDQPLLDKGTDSAIEEGDDLMHRMVKGAHAAIDRIADSATPAVERIKGTLGGSKQKLSDGADQAAATKDAWIGDVREMIRENPLLATAAAIAIGALYVKLTAPSRSRPIDDQRR